MTEPETAEAPKVLVRVRRDVGGLTADIREVGDPDAVAAALAEGFIEVEVPAAPFLAWPKWVYHKDGRRFVVQNEAELEALGEGFEDSPPPPESDDEAA